MPINDVFQTKVCFKCFTQMFPNNFPQNFCSCYQRTDQVCCRKEAEVTSGKNECQRRLNEVQDTSFQFSIKIESVAPFLEVSVK